VTGAGAGVGEAVASALAHAGAAVVAVDLNPDRADSVADAIRAAGGRVLAVQADVSNRFQASTAIEAGRDAFGSITLLVNAAGVYKTGAMLTLDEWDWNRVHEVNLTGTFFMTQLLARVMKDDGGGVIVNIASSISERASLENGIAYVSSKAALVGMTRQAARELAPHNIRINAVAPANIADDDVPRIPVESIPLRAHGTSDHVASAVLFLLSDGARYITGQTLIVDGGASLLQGG
jgi:NAD(P)-dependent dehydrogenase (short-subunit alcohol dehydrogenase family)